MRITEQQSVILGQTPTDIEEMCKFIELGGRVCYKSEDKITLDSSVGFVKRMIRSGHHSVLEHSNIVFKISEGGSEIDRWFAAFGERIRFHEMEIFHGDLYINGNLRAWADTLYTHMINNKMMHALYWVFTENFGFLFDRSAKGNDSCDGNAISIVTDMQDIPVRLRKYTARTITNRAMTHEIVRHRIDSAYSQESQRYVAYDGEMEFIKPIWAKDVHPTSILGKSVLTQQESSIWLNTCATIEAVYKSLRECGLKPQQAREVLPNSCKTEIVVTRGYFAWLWFFQLRCDKNADPMMQDMAGKLKDRFVSNFPEFKECF